MSQLATLLASTAGAFALGALIPKPLRARDPLGWACLAVALLALGALLIVNAGCAAVPDRQQEGPAAAERACIVYDPSPTFGPCTTDADCDIACQNSPCLTYACYTVTGECVPRGGKAYCDGINGQTWFCEGPNGNCCEPEPVQ